MRKKKTTVEYEDRSRREIDKEFKTEAEGVISKEEIHAPNDLMKSDVKDNSKAWASSTEETGKFSISEHSWKDEDIDHGLLKRNIQYYGSMVKDERDSNGEIVLKLFGGCAKKYVFKDKFYVERYILLYFKKTLAEKRYMTLGALSQWLGISCKMFHKYKDRDDFWGDLFSRAYEQMEAYLEEKIMDRRQNGYGIQFILQNRFGWSQKQTVEHTGNVVFEIGVLKPKVEEKEKKEEPTVIEVKAVSA
jgi:hypothetical protein